MSGIDLNAYAKAYRRKRVLSLCGRVGATGLAGYVLWTLFLPGSACGCVGQEVTRRTSCQSNMRQLGLALALYEQDNDGTLPAADLPVAGGVVTWRDRTFPYAKAAGLYSCPEDAAGRSSSTALPSSYGMNTILGRRSATPSHGKPFPLASVLRPSETIVLVDTRGSAGGGWDITDPAFLPEKGRELYAHGPKHTLFTHPSGRINILVADGHVKSLPPSYTLAPVNMWTRDNAPFTGTALRNARAILGHAASE